MVFSMAVPSAPVRKWPHVDSFVAMDFSCTESCNTEIPMFTTCGKVDMLKLTNYFNITSPESVQLTENRVALFA